MRKLAGPLRLALKTRFRKRSRKCDYFWSRHANGKHSILIDDPIKIDLAVRRGFDIRLASVYWQLLNDLMRNLDKTARNRKRALPVPVLFTGTFKESVDLLLERFAFKESVNLLFERFAFKNVLRD